MSAQKVEKAKRPTRGQRKPRAQRDSTLPPGEADRILDRLLLLEQVIPRKEVLQVLADTGCLDSRRCTLTFEVISWVVLAMGILTELPIRQVFKAARRLIPSDWDPISLQSVQGTPTSRRRAAPLALRASRPTAGQAAHPWFLLQGLADGRHGRLGLQRPRLGL